MSPEAISHELVLLASWCEKVRALPLDGRRPLSPLLEAVDAHLAHFLG